MGSRWSYAVTHHDKSVGFVTRDITEDTDVIPLFTDTSGGTINTGMIDINARGGRYIKTVSGVTVIDHNDRIRIVMTDGLGSPTNYNQVFEVVSKIPIKTKGKGTILRLKLEGIERHLQKVKYIKPFYFATPKQALIDLVAYYQSQKTDDMPSLTIGVNELPDQGVHHFDWGVNEESVYNRIKELVDLQGSSGPAGGVLDFFDFRFTYSTTNVTTFVINVFSSGSPSSGSEVTINALNVNTGETDGGIDEAEGTIIGVWGANGAGTLPIDYSRFKARQILLPTNGDSLYAPYINGATYQPDSIVQLNGITFSTPIATAAIPPSSPWSILGTANHYGNTIQYSPWTSGKVNQWKNSGGDPLGTKGPYGACMFDGNVILNDDTTFRTWVDLKTTSTPSVFWAYGNSTSGYYDGLRVLVNGIGTGVFSGTDSNGRTFDFNIAEFSAADNDWRVKYDTFGDPSLDSMQCAVFDEAKIYMWNNPNVGSWTDITSGNNGSDCFHPYDSLVQTTSVHIDPDTELEYVGINNGSGIKAVYNWLPIDDWFRDIFADRTGKDYFQAGAWLGIRFPFPRNDINGGATNPGSIYGGGSQGTLVKEPSGIDAQNMHFTHNGFRGFNTTSSDVFESLDYGPLSSIDFFTKIIYSFTNLIGTFQLPKGNFKMRAWMFDKSDHVVFQDFVIGFNNEYQSISLPISGFQIYRGRRPRHLPFALNDLVPPKGIASDEQFEFRHIVGFCIGTLESYDDNGRYSAGSGGDFGVGIQNLLFLAGITGGLVGEQFRTLELWIDGLRFGKPLLYVTPAVTGTTLVKHPDFIQQPDIANFEQIKSIGDSELEKAKFKRTEYDVQTEISTDVKFGDFVLFNDDEIVQESDSGADTVRGVAKHIEYSITKPVDGSGGGLRRMRISRRFT